MSRRPAEDPPSGRRGRRKSAARGSAAAATGADPAQALTRRARIMRVAFRCAFGTDADPAVAVAPGRVNLIGEHTDYNDGFVLPMAIDRGVGVAFRRRPDRVLRVRAMDLDAAPADIDLDALEPGRLEGWGAYVAGTAWALCKAGIPLPGADLAIHGDLPAGAGLSSSAAVEIAVARALCAAADAPWDAVAMALAARRVENEFVGVQSGIMDPFACAVCEQGHALLLDCRSLAHEAVPIPASAAIVIMDTGIRRGLAGEAYNERVAACGRAVQAIRAEHPEVRALRDVTPTLLESVRDALDPVTYRRARHVVEENARPAAMAAALRAGDLPAAGALLRASHESLRDLYEVSGPALDLAVACAEAHPACYGARLTGAGFGGCAIALVDAGRVQDFIHATATVYAGDSSGRPNFFASAPAGGACLVD